jgi:hypothetical protein
VKAPLRQLAALCGIVVLVFGNTLLNGLVYDDATLVVANDAYRRFDLSRIFLSLSNGVEYLPVRDITYALDYRVWGDTIAGFHLSNLLYYCCTIAAAYWFTRALLLHAGADGGQSSGQGNQLVPFCTAALFAVLPHHSEPVSALFTRNVLVSGLFFFLSSWLYTTAMDGRGGTPAPSPWRIGGVLLLYLCALLSKATTITLPLIFMAAACIRPSRERLRSAAWAILPALALMLAAVPFFKAIAARSHLIAADGSAAWGMGERLAVAIQIPVYYLGRMLVPLGLTIAYDVPFAVTLLDWKVAGAALILALLLAVAFSRRREQPLLLFGLLWYLITLVPVMNLFHTYPVVADRYLFLPSYGIALIVTALLLAEGRWAVQRKLVLVVAIAVMAVATFFQNRVYRDDTTLWEHAVAASPNVKSLSNLGWTYFHAGRHEEAFALFARLQRLNPNDRNRDLALGMYHFQRKEWREAVASLQMALAKKPDALDALDLLGQSYYALGDYPGAIACFEQVLASQEADTVGYRANAVRSIGILRQLMQQSGTGSR